MTTLLMEQLVAEALFLSLDAVRSGSRAKLGVHTAAEAVARVLREST